MARENEHEAIVSQVVTLLSQYSLAQMREILKEAENRLTNRRTRWVQADLENMFKDQLEYLKTHGYPTSVWRRFENCENEIIRKCEKMTFGEGNIPFLFSVPMSIRSMLDQVNDVAKCNGCEAVDFTLGHFDNLNNLDEGLSCVFDVNASTKLKRYEMIEQIKVLENQGRHCLTVADVTAVAANSNVFLEEKAMLFAAATYYGKEKEDATLVLYKITSDDHNDKKVVKVDIYIDRHNSLNSCIWKPLLPTFSERMLIKL